MSSTTFALIGVFCVLVVINLVGNTLVLMVVLRNRSMRTPMNYLLVNLSIADIMVAVSVAIQYIFGPAYEHPSGQTGDYLCRFLTGGNFTWVGTAASVFCLVEIAAERHDAIVIGKRKSRLEGYGLAVIIFCCWLFAFLLNLPLFLYLKFKGDQLGQNKCEENWPTIDRAKAYTVICFVASGIVPLALMVVLYSRIVFTLWLRPIVATGPSEEAIIESRKKVTKMLILVSLMYGLCRFPNLFMYLFAYYLPEAYVYGSTLYIVSIVLVCLNSTMNPFLYSLHSEKFRKHLWSIVCWKWYTFVEISDNNSGALSAVFYVNVAQEIPQTGSAADSSPAPS